MTVEVRNRQSRKPSGLRVNSPRLETLARRTLELVGADADYDLSIVLVSDEQIAELNARFHHVQGATDILSFDYGEERGELIISLDRVLTQSRRYHTTLVGELALYVIHGILHLHDHDDRTAGQLRRMRSAERRLMSRLAREGFTQGIIVQ